MDGLGEVPKTEKVSYLNPVLGTLVILGIVIIAVLFVRSWEKEKQAKNFNASANSYRQLIEGRIRSIRFELDSARRFFQGSSFIDRREFKSFMTEPIQKLPEILDIAWAAGVPHTKRADFETQPWQRGLGGRAIFRILSDGQRAVWDDMPYGDVYYPLTYGEPSKWLDAVVGLDLLSVPASAALIEKSRLSKQAITALGQPLWPGPSGEIPVLENKVTVFQPVFRTVSPDILDAGDITELNGFLILQFDLAKLITEALTGQAPDGIAVYVLQGDGDHKDVVYRYMLDGSDSGIPGLKDLSVDDSISLRSRLNGLGEDWTLFIAPTAIYLEKNKQYQSWGILLFGLLFTGVSSFLLFANKRQTDVIRETVERQTREITSANQSLEHEILQRKVQLHELEFLENAIDEHAIVSVADAQGDIVYVNEKFCQISGYDQHELLGQNHRILKSSAHDAAFYNAMWQTISAGSVWQGDLKNLSKQGRGYWLRTTIVPNVGADGRPFRFISICTEITENIQLETELRVSKHEADVANQAKSEFLSSMSHELRTPMNAILGFAQMLEFNPKEPLRKGQKESVQQILKGGQHLLELINEVLDLAKIETGKIELSIETVDVRGVLEEALSMVEGMAQERGITIEVADDCKSSINISADYMRFKQVLLNLLSNAIKYNRDNGQIYLKCAAEPDEKIRISVADTGQGIPVEQLDQLFEPFSRLGAENTEIEGTGIGLTITKQLIERMGGGIDVESKLGRGTTFSVILPAANECESMQTVSEMDDDVLLSKALPEINGTVLYVEDNPANLKLMDMIASRIDGLKMLSAHNGELALELAKQKQPDLIILDINLPGMDGFSVMKSLKGIAVTKDIPVVALSANAMARDVQKGLLAGFRFYLTKPIRVDELVHVFETILSGRT